MLLLALAAAAAGARRAHPLARAGSPDLLDEQPSARAAPDFELVQPDLFAAPGGMPNAWADFDNDGQLDEFVGFRGRPNRLYRQDHGRFVDVAAAAAAGVADNVETRAAAWGDYDGDGNVDLYVGFVSADGGTPILPVISTADCFASLAMTPLYSA
jgi:hypothetical protein